MQVSMVFHSYQIGKNAENTRFQENTGNENFHTPPLGTKRKTRTIEAQGSAGPCEAGGREVIYEKHLEELRPNVTF